MVERELSIVNRLGLHARAASKFVQTAAGFDADLKVSKDGREVSGRSIMGIMMLGAARGRRILVRADGPDAKAAVDALEELVRDRFGEGE